MADKRKPNNKNVSPSSLKPLPQPARQGARKSSNVSTRQRPYPNPIDPDDFDVDDPRRRRRNSPPEPTFAEALKAFFTRLRRRITKTPPPRQPIKGQRKSNSPYPHSARLYPTTRQTTRQTRRAPVTRINYTRIAGVTALAAVFIGLVTMFIITAASKNAIEIYLEDDKIGYIAISKEINEDIIQAQAVNKLASSLDASLQVDQTVRIQTARTSKKNIEPFDIIIDQISRKFTYKINAVVITVDGEDIAILRNQSEADKVAERLQAPYRNESTVFAEFVKPWENRSRLTGPDALEAIDDALSKLDRKTRRMEEYIVQRDDMLGSIALRNNTTVEKICADNPPMTSATIIQPGQVILLESIEPFMSVRTIDEVKRTDVIPMQSEEIHNPLEPVSYTLVIEEGRAGEQETTIRITRVNGVQIGAEEVINTSITISPITRVVEVGTAESVPNRR